LHLYSAFCILSPTPYSPLPTPPFINHCAIGTQGVHGEGFDIEARTDSGTHGLQLTRDVVNFDGLLCEHGARTLLTLRDGVPFTVQVFALRSEKILKQQHLLC